MFDLGGPLYTATTWVLPIVFAITLHEAAHGYVAWRLGDDTAHRMGRVTFNPIKHVDPVGTIILPGLLLLMSAPFLFGYAKPVPVNFRALGRPRRDMVLVALAGPGTNIAMAVGAALLFHLAMLVPSVTGEWLRQNLLNALLINVVLAVFNMLPLPPLDGGRVAVGLLPPALAMPLARLERYGIVILIGALFVLPMIGDRLGQDLNIFRWLVGGPVYAVIDLILMSTGLD